MFTSNAHRNIAVSKFLLRYILGVPESDCIEREMICLLSIKQTIYFK